MVVDGLKGETKMQNIEIKNKFLFRRPMKQLLSIRRLLSMIDSLHSFLIVLFSLFFCFVVIFLQSLTGFDWVLVRLDDLFIGCSGFMILSMDHLIESKCVLMGTGLEK